MPAFPAPNSQLNYYGFKKIPSTCKTIYYHKFFKQGQPGLLEHIQRKEKNRKEPQSKDEKSKKIKKIKKVKKEKKKRVLALTYDDMSSESERKDSSDFRDLEGNVNQLKFRLAGLEKRIYSQIIESNRLIQDQTFMMSQIFKMRKENDDKLNMLWNVILRLFNQTKGNEASFAQSLMSLGIPLNFPAIRYQPPSADQNEIVDYSLSKLETIQSEPASEKKNEKKDQPPDNFEEVDKKYANLLFGKPEDLSLQQESPVKDFNKNSVLAKKSDIKDCTSIDTNQENNSIYEKIPEETKKIITEIPPAISSKQPQLALVPTSTNKTNPVSFKKRKMNSTLFEDVKVYPKDSLPTPKVKQNDLGLAGVRSLGSQSNAQVDLLLSELFQVFQRQNIQVNHQHFIRNLIEIGLSYYISRWQLFVVTFRKTDQCEFEYHECLTFFGKPGAKLVKCVEE